MANRRYDAEDKVEALSKSLKATNIYEAKGSFNDIVSSDSYPLLKVIHVEIPTIDGSEVKNYANYIDEYIQKYNAYLGFDSGITSSMVMDAIDANVELFCAILLLKRFYDSKNYLDSRGHIIEKGLGNLFVSPRAGADANFVYAGQRIANELQSISNAIWVSDYIDPFNEIILPPNVASLYNYYISNYFDVTDDGNNESLVLLQFWPAIENVFDIGNSNLTMTKDKINLLITNMRNRNTTRVKDFCIRMLDWSRTYDLDMTRDIQGNSVNINRDLSLIDMFNNMIPTKCHTYNITSGEGVLSNAEIANSFDRLYWDFELPYSYDVTSPQELEDRPPLAYYYTVRQHSLRDLLFTTTNELSNGIIIDWNFQLLLAIFTETEVSRMHGGSVYSVLTAFNMISGSTVQRRAEVQQISIGSDIMLDFTDNSATPIDEDTLPIGILLGLVGDYNEAPEVKHELAIFKYAFDFEEQWRVKTQVHSQTTDPFIISSVDVNLMDFGSRYNEFWKNIHGVCFKMGTSDTDAARNAVLFRLFTALFYTYQEGVQYLDNLFNGKQQSNN